MTRKLHDGREDGLEPLESLDPDNVNSFSDLLRAMSKTAFGGRQLGEAFEIMKTMINDPECLVICTLSGAMTIAKQGLLLTRMIQHGMIDVIVSTGALITHGLVENSGLVHYKSSPDVNDEDLYNKGYNRVYDTLEQEKNLNDVEEIVSSSLDWLDQHITQPWGSQQITEAIGLTLSAQEKHDGILAAAFKKHVPIYIPAFTDSEVGLDLSFWAMRKSLEANTQEGQTSPKELPLSVVPPFNPYLDLNSYARKITNAKRLSIFIIGGGVPRNWAQQVSPYVDFICEQMEFDQRIPKFSSGVRICTDVPNHGGMSGCTFSEGKCLSGKSLIDCPRDLSLYPKGIPIRDLVGKKNFFVYCYDSQKITLGKVIRVWKTGHLPVWKLTFKWYKDSKSRSGELIATPTHKIMMIDGSYKRLQELNLEDRIMSFNSYLEPKTGNRFINLRDGRGYVLEHRFLGEKIQKNLLESSEHVHHIDDNHVVVDIEDMGITQDVYDISVDSHHNFVVNGIFVHNSWGKFEFEAKTAEVICDATLVLPLLIKGLLEDQKKNL